VPYKHRLILSLGWAIALSTPIESALAQERQNRQNEPRANEAPQQQDEGKPKEDQGKPKRKEDGGPKGRENRPAPEKKPAEEKPAPKSQSAPPPKAQAAPPATKDAPEKDSPAKAPPAPAPEKREPVDKDKDKAKPAPVDVQPVPAPKKEQPATAPPKATTPPPPAPDTGKATAPIKPESAPAKPEAAPAKPESGINSGPKPVTPGDKPAAPQPPATAPAPAPATAAPTPPGAAPQAAPQKPAVPNAPAAALPAAPANPAAPTAFQPGFQPAGTPPQKLQDIQKGRTERVEDGGKRTVIQEIDNRVIIKQDNRTIIRHDETQRFAKNATDVKSEKRADGTTVTIIVQPGGIQIFNIVDNSGRTVRRYRRDDRGREVDIIDNRSFYKGGAVLGVGLVVGAVALALRPPEIRIPREKYVVDYERASDDDIYETLTAPPVEKLERRYSLEEVRFSHELRERMRRLDLDTVTFEFGSWEVSSAQFSKLERVAKVMDRVLQNKPDEVFLVEGHTDAVGSDVDNLTLSDRRAQSVAEILTGVFRVPAENLVTQGYGEQYLKVPTQGAEQANRRVAIRRITPLMADSK
jgi:outer membrane protein OmpA-like peptidoglycan-associated protein